MGKPLVPPGLGFEGRPQLVARFVGAGGGKSLLFNGHIDAVSVEPIDRWTSNPFEAEVRDGNLYGRGSCDMKGGIAAMTLAAEVIAEGGVELAGDLIVATNTDEESSGAGSSAIVARGIEADAGIVTEATGFDVWVACRGSEYGVVTVPGRPGHAEVFQRSWREGGAVNAIEKAVVVIEAMHALRSEWSTRAGLDHPYLSRPDVLPTMASAGDWPVTYPASCELTCAVLYLPSQADEQGWGSDVRREVEEWILRETARDGWLAENPPRFEWWPSGVMPMEIGDSDPIVAGDARGRPGTSGGPASSSGSTRGTTEPRSPISPVFPRSPTGRAGSRRSRAVRASRTRSTSTCPSTTSSGAPRRSPCAQCVSAGRSSPRRSSDESSCVGRSVGKASNRPRPRPCCSSNQSCCGGSQDRAAQPCLTRAPSVGRSS